eukprot:14438803-Alexandrium_andersonii.AAC.1
MRHPHADQESLAGPARPPGGPNAPPGSQVRQGGPECLQGGSGREREVILLESNILGCIAAAD